MSYIIKIAMQIMKDSKISAVPTDKDGGYCLVNKEDLHNEMLNIMRGDEYKPVPRRFFLASDVLQE